MKKKNKFRIGSLLSDNCGIFMILEIYKYNNRVKVLTNFGEINYWCYSILELDRLIVY